MITTAICLPPLAQLSSRVEMGLLQRRSWLWFSFPANTAMFEAARVCGLEVNSGRNLNGASKDRNYSGGSSYQNAVCALNNLQSNAITIQQSIVRQNDNLAETRKYLHRSGLTLEDLDKLSMIHVSGTKGKGSTCALTESILRSFGLKTGFYSSPHLISVTERFRINGKPISENDFATNFWKVYNRLNDSKEHEKDMPPYFKFLTILCFHIFLEKQVDVSIIEVGVGGLKDCTNIIRNTKTVGITSLGFDHTSLLGNTLKEIAFQKAGIIKQGSNVFTIQQPDECLPVIEEEAKNNNAKLFIVPDYSEYHFKKLPELQIQSKAQKVNASLAIQLAYDWLKHYRINQLNGFGKKLNVAGITFEVADQIVDGINNCYWPGRCQVVQFHKKRFHLDGAHTLESLDVCKNWFLTMTENRKKPKCLIFNATGDRNSKQMIDVLNAMEIFEVAMFVPNIPSSDEKKKDNESFTNPKADQLKRCINHSEHWNTANKKQEGKYFENITDAILYLDEKYRGDHQEIDILVTGSIHLIGATLLALDNVEHSMAKV